ncbi:ABC transporter ATP-binding protein [Candidatus Riflebacteria bacterium]
MENPAIYINNLKKNYQDVKALKGVSFSVAEGEFMGLLGPNGAGKTTLINILVGLSIKTTGEVQVLGFDVEKDYQKTRSLLGLVPQELIYDHFFSVDETLEIISGYYGISGNKEWRDHLVERLELNEHRHKRTFQLSGGMKRRLLIAKALVHKPRILILDEPTAGVDVGLRQIFWDFMKELHTEEGMTIILTTHYLEEAEVNCENVGIIHKGELLALDSVNNLKKSWSKKRIYFELQKKPDALHHNLEAFKPQLSDDGLKLCLSVDPSKQNFNELFSILALNQLEINNIETRSVSLEEVFMHMINGQDNVQSTL